jgi:hypothetical protein
MKGNGGDVVLYQTPGGQTSLEVRLKKETVWLSQRQMADLFDKDSDTIGLHIRNIFKEGELDAVSTTEESSVVQSEGDRRIRRQIRLYNLDVIISVGYRVKSKRGTQFRICHNRFRIYKKMQRAQSRKDAESKYINIDVDVTWNSR